MTPAPQSLYLIRHGQTTADSSRIIGITDQPLSMQGKNQAMRLASSLAESTATTIFCSGLSRSIETASLLKGETELDVQSSDLINEMNFGDWENQTWDSIYERDPEFFNHWANNWVTVSPPNGECFKDVIVRCHDWYNQTQTSGESIIVAHGGSIRALLSIMLELPASSLFNFELDHCKVTKINRRDGRTKAAYMNIPCFA